MPDQLQLRGGTTAQNDAFTGAAREVTVDTTKNTLIVHNNVDAGGAALLREDGANSELILGSAATPSLKFTGDTNTGIFSPGADQVAVSTGGTERVEFGASEVVFNDGGANYDFRVEGDTNANLLFVDASTDRIGVGTSSPSRKLHIVPSGSDAYDAIQIGAGLYIGNTSDNNNAALFHQGGGADLEIGSQQHITFTTGNVAGSATERLRIDSSGRVGIGTSSPGSYNSEADDLVIYNSGDGGITLATGSSTGQNKIYFAKGTTGSEQYQGYIVYNQSAASSGSMVFGVGGSNKVAITEAGNIGIGTTSPSRKLHVDSGSTDTAALFYSSDAGVYINFQDSTSAASGVTIGGVGDDLRFGSGGGGEFGRFDSSGRLLVGTTSAPTLSAGQYGKIVNIGNTAESNGDARLVIGREETASAMSSGDSVGQINFTDSAGADFARIQTRVDGTPGTNDYPGRLEFYTTADGASSLTERMRIANNGAIGLNYTAPAYSTEIKWSTTDPDTRLLTLRSNWQANSQVQCRFFTDGDVENRNNSYGAISDAKLKENIVDANSQWNDIKGLRVRNYNFISSPENRQIGVVAQEVELVSPGLVANRADEDEQGNDLGTVTKTVNYSVLYMKAVKALQEAMERIETLEAKVAALEAN